MKKNAQMNQTFVFILSIIMVVFVGFLVIKFVKVFFDDTNSVLINKFYEKFEKDYNNIYSNSDSDGVYSYKVTNEIRYVCFISNIDCIASFSNDIISDTMKDDFEILFDAGDNVVMFDNKYISNNRKIGNFIVDKSRNSGNQCLCLNPKQGYFELFLEKINNKVYLSESE